MSTRIRAVIVEDEPLSSQYLATLLDETCQVEVIGTASEAAAGLALCAVLRPDAVFLDVRLPGPDGVSLAGQLNMPLQPPRLVFTTGHADRATDAFRLEAVDYLLKPLDPDQVAEAVQRLRACLQPLGGDTLPAMAERREGDSNLEDPELFRGSPGGLLSVKDVDRDQIRLLSRREVAAVLRHDRRTWVHTVREEFATYYPLADVIRWLGGDPFIQVARDAVVNLRALERVVHYGDRLYRVRLRDRLYRVRLRDRLGSEITVSRSGAAQLAAVLKGRSGGERTDKVQTALS